MHEHKAVTRGRDFQLLVTLFRAVKRRRDAERDNIYRCCVLQYRPGNDRSRLNLLMKSLNAKTLDRTRRDQPFFAGNERAFARDFAIARETVT